MSEQNAADLISLPQGGGALAGIGETFQPDPHTGTGNFQIPLPLPRGRGALQPKLALSYSTGNPNGPFGLGWALSLPQVRRKTSQGVPRYDPANEGTFILSGAEDLVRVKSETVGTGPQQEHRDYYRPRTETLFARIVHVKGVAGDYWDVWSKDGLRSRYGTPTTSDAADGTDPTVIRGDHGIFAWLISETIDPLGNRVAYAYRSDPAGSPMRYLSEVGYADYGDTGTSQFRVRVEVSYEGRPDPFSDRRPGFDLRTTLRATGLKVFTRTSAPTPGTTVDLTATTVALTYADQLGPRPGNGVSLLQKIQITGHDGSSTQPLPPIELDYTAWQPEERRFSPLTGDVPATSLGAPGLDLVDLFGSGRPCIVELNGFARYWRNRGAGAFDPPRTLRAAPAGVALGAPGVQLADMDGDGRPDLLVSSATATGYWPLAALPNGADGEPAGFDPAGYVKAGEAPTISLSDPTVRLIDLDGDGRVDVLRAGQQLVAAYNDGRGGFRQLQVLHPPDGLTGISFGDPRVRLADMTGDGLTDVVLLHDGGVSYWPNLGHGSFGPRVVMLGPPRFEDGKEYDVTGFDPRRLLLGDVDGDGAADLVYVGDGHVTVWVNQAGNSFAAPVVVPGTPRVSDASAIRLADVEGNGVAGVLWSADSVRPRVAYAFLDLTGGVKPYLLRRVDNHRGATTTIEYATSTAYAAADRVAGRPWRTTLPFPVQVVARVTVEDAFSKSALTTEYHYHHGYWDGADREFRGFARVDQRDAQLFADGDDRSHAPPTETRTWFHVGPVGPEYGAWRPLDLRDEYWPEDPALLGDPTVLALPDTLSRRQLRDAQRALRGSVLRSELYALDGDPAQARPYTVTEHQYEVTLAADPPTPPAPPATGAGLTIAAALAQASVLAPAPAAEPTAPLPFFPHPIGERATEWERGSEPRTRLSWTGGYDAYGRAHLTFDVAVPRARNPRVHDDFAPEPYLATAGVVSYATRDDADRYLLDRQVASVSYELVNNGRPSVPELRATVASGRGVALRLLGYGHTFYDGQPLGSLGVWGLPTSDEQLALTMGQLARGFSPDGTIADPPVVPPYLLVGDAVPTDGLRADYFDDLALTRRALTRPEPTPDVDGNGYAPDPVLTPGRFSARWTGTLLPRYSESYTFSADCLGGTRVWVDGALVLDAWSGSAGGESAPVALTANHPVPLKVEFQAASPEARLRVLWSSPSQAAEPLPRERLAPPAWPVAWGPSDVDLDYPDAFRAVLPGGAAGYTYHRADAAHFDGYYQTTRRQYDVQDDPATGRGLLHWEEDALGHRASVEYDSPYQMLPVKVTDAAGLVRTASYDHRVLKPNLVVDANGNRTAVGYTPLGLPAWIAVMGKDGADEGDTPEQPGTRFDYGLTAWDDSPSDDRQPVWVHTTRRVEHRWQLVDAENQLRAQAGQPPLTAAEIAAMFPANEREQFPERFIRKQEFSDGFGRLLQSRTQAEDVVWAPPPALYATGVDADGHPLAEGGVDPHWTIAAQPAGAATAPAYVTLGNRHPLDGTWLPNSATSHWISPHPDQSASDAAGSYTYQTQFDLTGTDPVDLRIGARIGADDTVMDVRLNGQSLNLGALAGDGAFTPLDVEGPFIAGVNTLEIIVLNAPYSGVNSTGLRVEWSPAPARRLFGETSPDQDAAIDRPLVPLDQSFPGGAVAGRTVADPSGNPRVTVSGWQVYDNKGRVVEKYESFFSLGWDYAPQDAPLGEKVTMFYDPRGRVTRTLNPDGSEQRVVYGIPPDLTKPDEFIPTPWETYTYDANDLAPLSRAPSQDLFANANVPQPGDPSACVPPFAVPTTGTPVLAGSITVVSDGPRPFVSGSGKTGSKEFHFWAASDPDGANPRGYADVTFEGTKVRGSVKGLRIGGNAATVGILVEQSSVANYAGDAFFFAVVDSHAPGAPAAGPSLADHAPTSHHYTPSSAVVDALDRVVSQTVRNGLSPVSAPSTTFDVPDSTDTHLSFANFQGDFAGSYTDGSGRSHGFLLRDGSYTTVDFPGAAGTGLGGIGSDGTLFGSYTDGSGRSHAFLLRDGSYTTVDPPDTKFAAIAGIGPDGAVFGTYADGNLHGHGFVLLNGSYTTLDPPDSHSTAIGGVGPDGAVVGWYGDTSGHVHGFLLRAGSYTPLDVPGAVATNAYGINQQGDVVGMYIDGNDHWHGFLLKNGSYTTLDLPGAVFIWPNLVDSQGNVGGSYQDRSGYWHGFLLANEASRVSGRYTTLDDPDATRAYTFPLGINLQGDVVGNYVGANGDGFLRRNGSYATLNAPEATFYYPVEITSGSAVVGYYGDSNNVAHGFLLRDGSYTTFDVPGAASTLAMGITPGGVVVGNYSNVSNGPSRGYLLRDGTYAPFDVPGATWTSAQRISPDGVVVGFYVDSSKHTHGFLLRDGSYTTLDVPGSTEIYASGINPQGEVVGTYRDSAGKLHGFVLRNGSYTTLDVPGSRHTWAQGIDSHGNIVGAYEDADGGTRGYRLSSGDTTRSTYDIQGNLVAVTDALGRVAFRHAYDLLKRPLRVESIDAGTRRVVYDANGNPLEQRDAKGALTLHAYDALNRPTRLWARDAAGQAVTLREKLVYGDAPDAGLSGDAVLAANLRGKLYQHHDEAGQLTFAAYDFKGNPLEKAREVIADAVMLAPFTSPPADGVIQPFRVDWEAPPALDSAVYETSLAYDALNRVTALRYPLDVSSGGDPAKRKTLRPRYNRAGALEHVELDGQVYVDQIAYNAKGQRTLVAYGNGYLTRYAYDPRTFRLARLRTEKYTQPEKEAYAPSGGVLQDYAYEYDLAGNVTAIHDRAPKSGIAGTVSGPDALDRAFDYDPLYRLLSATGRESDQNPPTPWDAGPRDVTKVRPYVEQYQYDPAGNLLQLQHSAGSGSYTRQLAFAPGDASSHGVPANNRLKTVTIGGTTFTYAYDPSGNLTDESTSRHYGWDHADRMTVFRTQTAGSEPTVYAQYLYDAAGQRVKKLVRSKVGEKGVQVETTVYVDGVFEHHRQVDPAGGSRENDVLQVMDGHSRVALVRVGDPFPDDRGPAVQYHLGDHLGSSNLVIDGNGNWTNREEYLPYGETSYGSFARKRYRYTSKLRDEESGLCYHGARYYAPWLARWASCDPAGCSNWSSLYLYGKDHPERFVDPDGRADHESYLQGMYNRHPWIQREAAERARRFGSAMYHRDEPLQIVGSFGTPQADRVLGSRTFIDLAKYATTVSLHLALGAGIGAIAPRIVLEGLALIDSFQAGLGLGEALTGTSIRNRPLTTLERLERVLDAGVLVLSVAAGASEQVHDPPVFGAGSATQSQVGVHVGDFPIHEELAVEAEWVGKGSRGKPARSTVLGYERGNLFRTLRRRFPTLFPKGTSNPMVTQALAQKYPEFQPYIGEKLAEHHLSQGYLMYPLPESVHKNSSDYLHGFDQDVSSTANQVMSNAPAPHGGPL